MDKISIYSLYNLLRIQHNFFAMFVGFLFIFTFFIGQISIYLLYLFNDVPISQEMYISILIDIIVLIFFIAYFKNKTAVTKILLTRGINVSGIVKSSQASPYSSWTITFTYEYANKPFENELVLTKYFDIAQFKEIKEGDSMQIVIDPAKPEKFLPKL